MHDGHEHEHGKHEHEHHGTAAVTSTAAYAVRPVPHAWGKGWLTPAEVRGQVFGTVRLREGYEMREVDTFLDKVEATLDAVLADNQDLRAQLTLAEQATARATARAAAQAARAAEPGGDAGRIIALAQQAADQAITAAEQEAAAIVARACEHAEAVTQQALDQGTHMRESLKAQARQLRALLRELDTCADALSATPHSPPGAVEPTAATPHPADRPLVPAQPTHADPNRHTPPPAGTDRRSDER